MFKFLSTMKGFLLPEQGSSVESVTSSVIFPTSWRV